MDQQVDKCKVVTLGFSGVGKTSLLQRIMFGTFDNVCSSTIGIDFSVKIVDLGSKLIKLQLCDTAGQENFDSLSTMYLRNAMCVLLVYDITNEESCFKLNKWLNLINQVLPSDVIKILVGNKCDEHTRMIPTEIGNAVADYLKIPFIEVSSKENINVDELLEIMVAMLVQLLDTRKLLSLEEKLQDAFQISLCETKEPSVWEWLSQRC